MQKNLVIVESPAKAKTIERFLGKNYRVVASVGHIRDLPKSTLGIDIEKNFEPKYITIRGKGPLIKDLKDEAKKAKKVFLATDPDREGEAISWHLAYILGLDKKDKIRVEFNEITKDSITNAIKKPRQINEDLVDAQQARRVLDRLVGYQISPLLWRKIRRGLSAGRVQSIAVKLICDRESEIEGFIPEEYWTIKAKLENNKQKFEANFYGKLIDGKEIKFDLKNVEETNEIISRIDKENFTVKHIKTGTKKRNPYPPYTTSTLQQDASKKIGFTTKKTMMVAQQLYEGIDIKGEGSVGLITYMRTDSTRISKEAMESAKEFIVSNYGDKYTEGFKDYSNKSKKDSQDAHEGIRPSKVDRTPISIKESLSSEQYKLYKLIWERFMASQMSSATYNTISITMNSNDILFKTTGSNVSFEGFLKVYMVEDEDKNTKFPSLELNQKLKLDEILSDQHYTQPPARYTEAALIKVLEELGIGRPSTFAPTIATILARSYVKLEKKSFIPTELGMLVNDLLIEYFKDVINEEFTADLEEKLDDIAEGKLQWPKVVEGFYSNFSVYLKKADEEIEQIEIEDEVSDVICEKCGRNLVVKHGRFGKFLACPGYPECKNTKAIVEELSVKCPKCEGNLVKRKSKRGRIFYGCTKYPECDFTSWDEPIEEKCPLCNSYMTTKEIKNQKVIKCSNKECNYSDVKKV